MADSVLSTIIGGIVTGVSAGLAAGLTFFLKRQGAPRATVCHHIEHYPIKEASAVLLRVGVLIQNKGEKRLSFERCHVRVYGMVPWPECFVESVRTRKDPVPVGATEVDWPIICERTANLGQLKIESNESDEIPFDFVLPPDVQTVIVYSHLENATHSMWMTWRNRIRREIARGCKKIRRTFGYRMRAGRTSWRWLRWPASFVERHCHRAVRTSYPMGWNTSTTYPTEKSRLFLQSAMSDDRMPRSAEA